VHGRIRWKRDKVKVEASPDAEYVLINGNKMTNGSIDAGDEVAVGPCRIFLLRMDEGPVSAGRPGRGAVAEESRTMVVPPPVPATRQRDEPVRYGPPSTEKGSRSRYVRPGDRPADKPEWAREMVAAELTSTGVAQPNRTGKEPTGLKGRF